jgi:hypothetical protein
VPHLVRSCADCGKAKHILEYGEGGGIQLRQGDNFVIPGGAIRLSFDPTQSTGVLFRPGVSFLVETFHFNGQVAAPEEFEKTLAAYETQAEEVLKSSPLLKHLNIDDTAHHEEVWKICQQNKGKAEWWAALVSGTVTFVREAIAAKDAGRAAWLTNRLDVFRSMLLFQQHLEPLTWQGYTSRRLREILDLLRANEDNDDEEFWQKTLTQNAVILSQLFAFPVIVLQGKAYVGGKGIENSGAKLVDFLLANKLTTGTALVEIKTPKTRLLAGEYRAGSFPPSGELAGAIAQVLLYKDAFAKHYHALLAESDTPFRSFEPQCVIVAGNFRKEITTPEKHASFDVFRNSLRGIQVVTYDEMFAKVETFLSLLAGG